MICIVRIKDGEPVGWIVASDIDDATRKAHAAGMQDLADAFYRMYQLPPPGRHRIAPDLWLLIE